MTTKEALAKIESKDYINSIEVDNGVVSIVFTNGNESKLPYSASNLFTYLHAIEDCETNRG